MDISPTDITVKLKLNNSSSVLAQAEVSLGFIEIKGWRVMASSKGIKHPRFMEEIWITPPSYKAGPKFYHIIFIDDTNFYEAIEEAIYNEYHRQCVIRSRTPDEKEVINVDDIPV